MFAANDSVVSLRSSTVQTRVKSLERKLSPTAIQIYTAEAKEGELLVDGVVKSCKDLPTSGLDVVARLEECLRSAVF